VGHRDVEIMTSFEALYLCLEPFLPPLQSRVRRELAKVAKRSAVTAVLDVGGRKSPYTIGVSGRVTISDLPRTSNVQKQLNLGVTDAMIETTRARRSNVEAIVIDDMTCSRFPDRAFDCVVAVEVIEHVEADGAFVDQVNRVLKDDGTFLLTTPNGDWVENTNPDHKRHYTRDELKALLLEHFANVQVEYAIKDGTFRVLGLRSWSIRHPLRTAVTMVSNLANSLQSARRALRDQPHGTRHLIATARNPRRRDTYQASARQTERRSTHRLTVVHG
jgi:SAM-dependent methyltransferase